MAYKMRNCWTVRLWEEPDKVLTNSFRQWGTTSSRTLSKKISTYSTRRLRIECSKVNGLAGSPQRIQDAERLVLPMSIAEERLWFLDQLDPGKSVHNVPLALRLSGPLDIGALNTAIQEIVRRHESLRTTFAEIGGQPRQIVSVSNPSTLAFSDLRYLPLPERESHATRAAMEEAGRPFDLRRGPLLRTRLFQLRDEEHLLLIVMHRIVCDDDESMRVFLREMAVLYNSFLLGRSSPLPDLPMQYGDYSVWQRGYLQGEVLDRQLSYWREQLKGAPTVVEWPADRTRPATQSYQGARQRIVLPRDMSAGLRELSVKEKVTLPTVLHAVFLILLFRYTRQEDLVIGIPVSGRSVQTQGLIGLFRNSLALRTRLSGAISFRKFLDQVQRVVSDGLAHQGLPFDLLVQTMQPDRSLAFTPVYQTMFIFHDGAEEPLQMSGLTTTPFEIEIGSSMFDLTLLARNAKHGLGLSLEYNSDLFDPATISRMLNHLQNLMKGIIQNPEERIATLPLLSERERNQVLEKWNNTRAVYSRSECIHNLFEAQVERTPNAVAIVFEKERLTYRHLNERANQLAHYLREAGVHPEVPVGVCLERSLEMVVGILAILKAGGAYVPLDPNYPQERLAFMVNDSNMPVILTQKKFLARMPEQSQLVCLDRISKVVARGSKANPRLALKPENLAYIIYTSGSTGRPKGVMIEHRSTVALLYWAWEIFAPRYLDGVLASTSICFDLSVFELFVPLSWGGKVVLVENILKLSRSLAAGEVTLVNTVPSAIAELLRENSLPRSVRVVNLAGEPLSTELVKQIYAGGLVEKVYDLYGPSEDTTYSTFACRSSGGPATIGRPIANTQVYLLDEEMQPVPIGVPGEIYIGGEGLARGYFNRPELTAARFVPNPFDPSGASRLYRTGDRGRYSSDGNLEFLGRLDHQIKLRGFRIELEEIGATLMRHSKVRETVALLVETPDGDKRLAAYVVPKPGQPRPKPGEMRDFLKTQLPDYMVPATLMVLDAFPLTPNGKLDRAALGLLGQSGSEREEVFVAPRNEWETGLVEIWERLLGTKPISVTDNFFNLGGHSLMAVRLFSEIKLRFSVTLPLASIFRAATVEQLAELLGGGERPAGWSSLTAIQPSGSNPQLFCVSGADGGVHPFDKLAKLLGLDQPVMVLHPARMDGTERVPLSLAEIADHYVREMREAQPEGPYYLVGYSLGGNVVYEMALQLCAQGQKVAFLALLDAPNMNFRRSLRKYLWLYGHHAKQMLFGPDRLNYLRGKISHRARRIACWIAAATGYPLPAKARNVFDIQMHAAVHYRPAAYPGRVDLFRAAVKDRLDPEEDHMGWNGLARGGVVVQEIPGDHNTMNAEWNLAVLAEKLSRCLERARADMTTTVRPS